MKIIIGFMTAILLLNSVNQSMAYNLNRYNWWKVRLKTLESRGTETARERYFDKTVRNLLNSEIESAKYIISIFENGSYEENKNINDDSIHSVENVSKKVTDTFSEIFPVYFAEAFLKHINNRDNFKKIKTLAKRRLDEIIISNLNENEKQLADVIYRENFRKNIWKNILMGTTLEFFMKNKRIALDTAGSLTVNNFLNNIFSNKNGFRYNKFEKVITDFIISDFEKYGISGNGKLKRRDLYYSTIWQNIFRNIEKDIKNLANITYRYPFLKKYSNLDLWLLCRRPLKLAENIFNIMHKNHIIRNLKDNYITRNRNFLITLRSINRIRRSFLKKSFVQNSDKGYTSIEKDITIAAERFAYYEHKRLNNSSSNEMIVKDINFIKYYKDENIKFIKWVYNEFLPDYSKIESQYRDKNNRSKKYIKFLKNLLLNREYIKYAGNNKFFNRYFNTARSMDSIFRFISHSMIIDDPKVGRYRKDKVSKINVLRDGAINELKEARHELRKLSVSMAKENKLKNLEFDKFIKQSSDQIAQLEIDLLYKHAYDYVKNYKRYSYGRSIFYKYQDVFNKLLNDINNGDAVIKYSGISDIKSILVMISGYSRGKILKEKNIRSDLRNAGRASIAKLTALMKYYKKKNVNIKHYPDIEDIKELGRTLASKPGIKIAQWMMNHSNFEKVDRNIIKFLRNKLIRNMWHITGNEKSINNTGNIHIIDINKGKLSIKIPGGWQEKVPQNTEKSSGVLKSFRSIDNKSIINIVKIDDKEERVKKISEDWLKKRGLRLIRKRWCRNKNYDFFWVISNDKSRNLTETYAFSRNGAVLIISGKVIKDKYSFFRDKLKSVFQSIEVDI